MLWGVFHSCPWIQVPPLCHQPHYPHVNVFAPCVSSVHPLSSVFATHLISLPDLPVNSASKDLAGHSPGCLPHLQSLRTLETGKSLELLAILLSTPSNAHMDDSAPDKTLHSFNIKIHTIRSPFLFICFSVYPSPVTFTLCRILLIKIP